MQATHERLTTDIQHCSSINPGQADLHRAALVMKLDVDPHKAGNIIDCRIVYVIFFIIVIS